jgi:flagellar protein FlbT
MALKINLKPGERIVVNGAVLENGDRRISLLVKNRASILRQKDIMQPEEVTTPARHVYFQVMMMYLDPDSRSEHYAMFTQRLAEFIGAISSKSGLELCVRIGEQVMSGSLYQALVTCRKLLDFEKERLGS